MSIKTFWQWKRYRCDCGFQTNNKVEAHLHMATTRWHDLTVHRRD